MFSVIKISSILSVNCRLLATATAAPKIALVLSGCGVYDGSEVTEASSMLIHLSRAGANVKSFAPDKPQMHVIDHVKGSPLKDQERNVLTESARITRGQIADLKELDVNNFDAVLFPGGFGAAKNLSTFAVDAANMKIDPDVEKVLKDFHKQGKPIGLCCIAPVLAAKAISGCEVTVGQEVDEGGQWPYAGTAAVIKEMGARHVRKSVTEAHVDQKNKIVTTPAFMCNTDFHEVYDGIGEMVKEVLELLERKK